MKRRSWLLALVAAACGSSFATPDAAPDPAPDARAQAPDAAPPAPSDLDRLEALVAALPDAPDRDALVREFLTTVAYGERGFPIRESGQLAVVLYGETGALTVAGDFNGWDAAALPLAQPVPGFAFHYVVTSIYEPLPRTLYKFVRDGTEWFADPWARRYGWDGYGEYSLVDAGGTAHLQRWPEFARGAGVLDPREVSVYVPAGEPPPGGYRVVYMHDGQNLFDPDAFFGGWRAGDAAAAAVAAGAEPFLVVAIPNSPARMDEYTPVTEEIGGSIVGGRADEYVGFLVDGVKPFVDARYPTRAAREHTAIAGSSLGGVISFYALWARPDVFGHAASLSGAFWWGSGALSNPTIIHMYAGAPPPADATFYLDSGGDDGGGCVDSDGDGVSDDGFDSDGYCPTLDVRNVLLGAGFDPVYRWEPGAPHNEAAWAGRLPGVFLDWFPGAP